MRNPFRFNLLAVWLLMAALISLLNPNPVAAQGYSCLPNFFHIYTSSGIVSRLDASTNPFTYQTIATFGRSLNAAAYNNADGYLYFQDQASPYRIWKMDAAGNFTDTGFRPLASGNVRGDCDLSNNYMSMSASTLYIVNLSTGAVTTRALSSNFQALDGAYMAADGNLYGVHNSGTSAVVYGLNPSTGAVWTVDITGSLETDPGNGNQWGASWTANDNYLYVGNNTSGRLYKINITTGSSVYVGTGQSGLSVNDAASCPLAASPFAGSASVGNRVWNDTDNDGIQDAGEAGVQNVTVKLYTTGNSLIGTRTTDSNGLYAYTNIIPGEYYLEFSTLPSSWQFTAQNQGGDDALDSDVSPVTGRTGTFTLNLGDNNDFQDAGAYLPSGSLANIGDKVFEDLDRDGIQDAGEGGLSGVVVTLYNGSGTQIGSSATTASDGTFAFTGLAPGDYYLIFSGLPSGYAFSPQDQGADDAADSDANASTGGTATTTLSAAETDYTWDAGAYPLVPEMDVQGNSTSISNGDVVPSSTDHTDFGATTVTGGTVVRTFTIVNTGDADLLLTGSPIVTISGTHSGDFTVTSQPVSPVASSGGTRTFQVSFDPSASGTRSATISIENDDGDENPYNFSIQGTGLNTYTVTYEGNGSTGGTDPADQTKTHGVDLTLSDQGTLVRTGHTFAGWNTAADGSGTAYAAGGTYSAEEGATLYAQWTADTYTVTYEGNGSTGGTDPADQTKTHGVDLTLSDEGTLVRTGHTFAGWNTSADGSGTAYAAGGTYSAEEGATLYAQWTENTYTISGTIDDGTNPLASVTVTFSHDGSTVTTDASGFYSKPGVPFNTETEITPSKIGYTFDPINRSLAEISEDIPNQDFTGTLDTYTVTFEGNGSTGGTDPSDQTKTFGVDLTLSDEGTLVRTGHTFAEWNTAADGSGTAYAAGGTYSAEEGATLYAQWTADTYTVTYDGNGFTGGTGPADQTKTHGIALILSDKGTLTRTGHTFSEWNTVADGSGDSYAESASYTNNANLDLFAIWTADTYTVTYEGNGSTGGTDPVDQTKTHGVDLTLSDQGTLVKTGYTFSGWNTAAEGSGTAYAAGATYSVESGATLYAQWTADTYTVTYDGNGFTGGAEPSDQTKTHGVDLTLSDKGTLVRTGYTFVEWNTASDGSGTSYAESASYTNNANLDLFAIWTADTYTVTFEGNGSTGGTDPADQTKTYGVDLTLSDQGTLVKTGYTFSGWNTAADGSGTAHAAGGTYSAEEGATLYAQWTADTYTVTYDGNGFTGGADPADQTKTHGVDLTLSDKGTLVRTGYTFVEWNTASDGSGTSYAESASYTNNTNLDLFAIWTADTYTVTFEGNGSTGGTDPADQTKTFGVDLTLSDQGTLVKTGYTFAGWNTAADGSGTAYVAGATYSTEAGATLYAQWTADTYTVTYDGNGSTGGTDPADQTKTYGVDLTLSDEGTLVRTGYTFSGWNTAADGSGTSYSAGGTYSVESGATLYAQWTADTYTVTYDGNGFTGGAEPSDQTKTHGVDLTLSDKGTLVRTGYTFVEWNTASDGSGTSYAESASYTNNTNLDLFAIWTADTYTVTFEGNGSTGGTDPADQTKTFGVDLTLSDQGTLVKTGYTFSGWNTAADGSGTAYAAGGTYSAEEGATLYAQWTADTYTVTYDGNGNTDGTDPADQTKTFGVDLTLSDQGTLDRTGYTFSGWNTAADGSGTSYAAGGTYSVESGATLYAQWTEIAYTISGTIDDGTNPLAGVTVTFSYDGSTVTTDASGFYSKSGVPFNTETDITPSKTGYTFDPINRSLAELSEDRPNQDFTGTLDTYTVTFEGNGNTGGTDPADQTKTHGVDLTLSDQGTLVKTGYTFSGWNTSADGSGTSYSAGATYSVESGATLYAQWTADTYTVTYEGNGSTGGTDPADQTKTYGVDLTLSDQGTLDRTGYTFSGWNTAADGSGTSYAAGGTYSVESGATLYAQWTEIAYTISGTIDDGTNPLAGVTVTFSYDGSTVTTDASGFYSKSGVPFNTETDITPSKTGYTFDPINRSLAELSEDRPNQDFTGTLDTYTVTFEGNGSTGGSDPADQTKTYGVDLTLSDEGTLVRTGYTFSGWNTAADGSGTSYSAGATYSVESGATLYAQWTADTYTVTYEGNGSTGGTDPADQTKTHGVDLTLSDQGTLVKTGYTFAGWNTAADGAGTSYAAGGTYSAEAGATLYAQWTEIAYTISGTIDDGTNPLAGVTVTFSYDGSTVTTDASGFYSKSGVPFNTETDITPSKTGYTFDPINRSLAELSEDRPNQDFTGTLDTYTVTFEGNGSTGGSDPADQTKTYGVDLTLSDEGTLVRTGYTFSGWNTAADGSGTSYTAGGTYSVESGATLYAQWTADTYTVTYDGNGFTGGAEPSDQTKTHGVDLTLSDKGTLVRTGYTFVEWNTTADGSGDSYAESASYTNNANLDLFAIWTADTYTVTFEGNGNTGGTDPADQTKTHGVDLTLSDQGTLVKTGYTFSGWNTSADGSGTSYSAGGTYSVESGATLYAQWTADTYTVTYDGNGFTGGAEPSDQTKTHGVDLTLNDKGTLVRTGYTFVEWNTTADGSGDSYAESASYTNNTNLDLFAIWTADTYTVTFEGNGSTGGTDPADQTKTHGVDLTLSDQGTLVKTGYTFSGWNTSADGSGTSYSAGGTYSVESGATLYAQWTADTYTVTYDGNGFTGGAEPSDQTKTHGVDLTLSDKGTLVRTGYTFVEWNTTADGSGDSYAESASYTNNANLDLFAIWTADTYTVTFEGNGSTGGTDPADQTKTYGVDLTLSDQGTLDRTGYTFSGWNTAADGSGTAYAAGGTYSAEEGATLYAQWTADTYTVTYEGNGSTGGTDPADQTKTYGVDLTLSDQGTLVKTGYAFSGWNTSADGSGTSYTAGGTYSVESGATLYAQWTAMPSSVGDFVWNDLDKDGIQDVSEPGIPGITVNLYLAGGGSPTGKSRIASPAAVVGFFRSTTTDASGRYSFPDLQAGMYGIEFVLPAGYAFSSQDQGGDDAIDSDADVSTGRTVTFFLSPGESNSTWDAGMVRIQLLLSGVVKDPGGNPIPGVVITFSDGDTVITGSDGSWDREAPYGSDETVTPSKPGYTFGPVDSSFTNITEDKPNVNFTGTLDTKLVSGTITSGGVPLAGVLVSFSDGTSMTTGVDGAYSKSVPFGSNLTVTPTKTGYAFTPVSKSWTNIITDQVQNFTATRTTFVLSGIITLDGVPVPGVTVTFTGGGGGSVVTDSTGSYSKTVNKGATVLITPLKEGHIFSPMMKTWLNVQSDKVQNFTATLRNYVVSGFVMCEGRPLSGVTVTFSHDGRTETTNSLGFYSTLIQHGTTTTITAAKTGYGGWTPPERLLESISRSHLLQNFTCTLNRHLLSGIVKDPGGNPIPGVVITFADGDTVITGSDGSWDHEAPYGSDETVTPSKPGYTFGPADSSFTGITEDKPNVNFTGTHVLASITGNIWNDADKNASRNGGEPVLPYVTVVISDSTGNVVAEDSTDASGNYSFTGLAPGVYYVSADLTDPAMPGDPINTTGNHPARIVVLPEDIGLTVDFGFASNETGLGSIGFFTWHDSNWDRTKGQMEGMLPYVAVRLFRVIQNQGLSAGREENRIEMAVRGSTAGIRPSAQAEVQVDSVKSNYFGNFVFADLPAGEYVIQASQYGPDPSGVWRITTPDRIFIRLGAGEHVMNANFGFAYPWEAVPGSAGDLVWNDRNGNGRPDGGEPGLPGVTVRLSASGVTAATAVTGPDGSYRFDEVAPGDYEITIDAATVPPGYTGTTRNLPFAFFLPGSGSVTNADFGFKTVRPWGTDRRAILAGLKAGYTAETLRFWVPENRGGTADTALAGWYDGSDSVTARHQILSAWAAGIDGFVVDWKGSASVENRALKALLDETDRLNNTYEMQGFRFGIAASYGKDASGRRDSNLVFLADSILEHPAYWGQRSLTRRPLFVEADLPDSLARFRVTANAILPEDAFVVWNRLDTTGFGAAEAAFPRVRTSSGRWEMEGADWGEAYLDTSYARARRLMDNDRLTFAIGGVWPGFDDRNWVEGQDRFMNRSDSAVYIQTWRKALEAGETLPMPWVMIQSWNDFNRGTEIEASLEHGHRFVRFTRDQARLWKAAGAGWKGASDLGLVVPLHLMQAERAQALRPVDHDSVRVRLQMAYASFFAGDYASAMDWADVAAGVAPQPVHFLTLNDSTVQVAWEKAPSANQYHIYYSEDSTRFAPAVRPLQGVTVGDVTRFNLSGLKPGTTYWIAVTPVDTALGPFANEGWFENGITGGHAAKWTTTGNPAVPQGIADTAPRTAALFHNYPNPFNPSTRIRFALPKDQHVTLRIYDVRGREAIVLVDGKRTAGEHVVLLDASNLASGVYFAVMQTDGFRAVQRMLLVK